MAEEVRNHQVICLETPTLYKILQEEYGEKIISLGSYEGGFITVWQNTKKKTSSVVFTSTEKNESCLIVNTFENKTIDPGKCV